MTSTLSAARVAIIVPETKGGMATRVEMEVPSTVPLGDVMPDLIGELSVALESEGKDIEWLDDPKARFRLSKGINLVSFEESKSLQESGAEQGMDLFLTKYHPDEVFTPTQDDVSEGVAYFEKKNFPDWDAQDAKQFGVLLSGALGLLMFLAGAVFGQDSSPIRYPIMGVSIALAIAFFSVSVALYRTNSPMRNVAVMLMVLSYAAAACAAWVAIPRPPGMWHVLLVAVTTLSCSIVYSFASPEPKALHHGVGVPSAIVTFVMILDYFFPRPPHVVAAVIILVAVSVVLLGFRISIMFAKIESPYIPATGEPLIRETEKEKYDVTAASTRSTAQVANNSILNQEKKVVDAQHINNGIMAGVGALIVVCEFIMGLTFQVDYMWLVFLLGVQTAILLMYRGRYNAKRTTTRILLVAAFSSYVAFFAGLILNPIREYMVKDTNIMLMTGLGALTLAVVVGTLWALRERYIHSASVSRSLQFLEWAIISMTYPAVFFIAGVYSMIRHR